ncbi:MAG: beta-class carbonic anhydrase [Promethearchaeota archaeon]
MIKDYEKKLIEGNLKFQWKLNQESENINIHERIPKYPVLIITCMDPRIDIHRIFQLEPGDVFVLRNAGNLITTDMLRSILITIHEYNVKDIVILGHLDCGMTKIRIADLKARLYPKSLEFICRTGHNPLTELRNFFKPFIDELENVKNQVKTLKKFQGIPSNIEITGMLYDVDTGWIFEYEMLKDLKYIENFGKIYRDLLYMKRIQFVDFIESIEEEIVELDEISSKNEDIKGKEKIAQNVTEIPLNVKTDEVNHIDQHNFGILRKNILIDAPKIQIPKIILPKVRIDVPKIYRKKHQ